MKFTYSLIALVLSLSSQAMEAPAASQSSVAICFLQTDDHGRNVRLGFDARGSKLDIPEAPIFDKSITETAVDCARDFGFSIYATQVHTMLHFEYMNQSRRMMVDYVVVLMPEGTSSKSMVFLDSNEIRCPDNSVLKPLDNVVRNQQLFTLFDKVQYNDSLTKGETPVDRMRPTFGPNARAFATVSQGLFELYVKARLGQKVVQESSCAIL